MIGSNEVQCHQKGQGQNNAALSSRREQTMKNIENQLTTMLLLLTILFLILMFPVYIRFIYTNFVARDTPTKYAYFIFFYYLSHKLYFTNNGVNFFLYCISGQKFLDDLKDILGFGKQLNHRTETSQYRVTESSVGVTVTAQQRAQFNQAIEADQILSIVIGTLLLLRLISIKYYL